MSNLSTEQYKNFSNPNKVAEYFEIKKQMTAIRADIKDLQIQHPDYNELQKQSKKVKELRDNIKSDESIKELKEKLDTLKERKELLTELIRIDLIDSSSEEVKKDGKKLKLVYILKEVKDEAA